VREFIVRVQSSRFSLPDSIGINRGSKLKLEL